MASTAPSPKASLTANVDGADQVLKFTFNPSEYTIAKTAAWNRPQAKSAKKSTPPEFQGANQQTLQLEIFLDGENVATAIGTLISWVGPTPKTLKTKFPQPPLLTFTWGQNDVLTGFKAYLKSVSAKYTMFAPSGTPTRATANITLEEAPLPPGKTNPTSGAIQGRSVHVMREGESLQSVAYDEFGDPTVWRGIAAFNGIDDPLRLVPGQRVLVPTLNEVMRLA